MFLLIAIVGATKYFPKILPLLVKSGGRCFSFEQVVRGDQRFSALSTDTSYSSAHIQLFRYPNPPNLSISSRYLSSFAIDRASGRVSIFLSLKINYTNGSIFFNGLPF